MIGLGLGGEKLTPLRQQANPDSDSATEPEATRRLQTRLAACLGPRFEVKAPLAAGGMATLFLVEHRLHGGLLVAKVLREEFAKRPEVTEAFEREARHAACLGGHPNAIAVLDAFAVEDLHVLVMPFIEGEDLDALLKQHGPLSREMALHFAAQLASLLCHAESHGITHADIATGNIRLDTFGRYRLMDFGLSRSARQTHLRSLGGTPLYSSPEQIRGEVLDHRSDLYSLSVVLVEVLTGEQIFRAETLKDIEAKHLKGDWRVPEVLAGDAALLRLVKGLLATDRNCRTASAYELSAALATMGFDRPELRPRPGAGKTPGPGERRSRLSPDVVY